MEQLANNLFSRSPPRELWPLTALEIFWLALTLASIFVLLIVLCRWRLLRTREETTSRRLGRLLLGPKMLGYAAIAAFFGGFGGLAMVAMLASAAVAPGLVSPDGYRKTVEHLEGGIVSQIHVREGDHVEAGQVLLILEDIKARANFEELREKLVHLVSIEARLLAELSDASAVQHPAQLEGFDAEIIGPAIKAQQQLFESRRATLKGRERILGQRILQLEAEIGGLREMIAAADEQLNLIAQEIEGQERLYEKGLSPLPKLLALKRAQAGVRAERAKSRASIARNEQAIGETQLQLLSIGEERREQIAEELSEVRTELAAVRSQLPSRKDVLDRTTVTAPVSGTVMNVQVTTATGVVQPGEPLLDLVPEDTRLVIDAYVKPIDMDTVQPGQKARVLFTAYGQRNLPQIFGELRSISADRLIDEHTGEPYFLAKIEVDPSELERIAPDIVLSPGMPADVMILTGERTLLDYLMRPFIESVTKSFRES